MSSKTACLAMVAVAMLILAQVEVGSAVTCNPLQLSPCAGAITSGGTPSAACCAKLKEQKPCLCQYMKNPNLQKFIKSPGAKKVSSACRIPYPKCWIIIIIFLLLTAKYKYQVTLDELLATMIYVYHSLYIWWWVWPVIMSHVSCLELWCNN